MNDLIDLRDAWGQPDPPSQTAHSAARTALMRQIAADGDGTPVPALKPLRRPGVRTYAQQAGNQAATFMVLSSWP